MSALREAKLEINDRSFLFLPLDGLSLIHVSRLRGGKIQLLHLIC